MSSASSEMSDSGSDDFHSSNSSSSKSSSGESDVSDVIPVFPNRRMRISSNSSDRDQEMESNTRNYSFTNVPPGTNFSTENSHFFETPGLRDPPPRDSKPISYFDLFFNVILLTTIKNETNKYAQQFLENSSETLRNKSRAKAWKPVSVLELKAFIAVILEMGITRRPSIVSYWSTDSRGIPWFKQMFSRNRFQIILKFFHLIDNSTLAPSNHPDYDPCAKFNMIVVHANEVFRRHYIPNRQLSIDESLVGTHCHSKIKQYLPNKKHHRWGIKFWMLCDSITHYCLAFFCYRGAKLEQDKDDTKKFGLGHVVVMNLLKIGNYLDKGYHIFVDNFFTSIQLAKTLLERITYITGTIRRNRKYIPREAQVSQVGKPNYYKSDDILLCSYRDKKTKKHPVILISTNSNTSGVTVKKYRGSYETQTEKPQMIHEYNKYMGGIDESDKMLYVYLDERRTLKYWKKVTFNIFGRMVLNAYIIYSINNEGKKISRHEFTSKIIESIEREWLPTKKKAEISSTISFHKSKLQKLPGKNLRRCVVCSNKDGAGLRRSTTICAYCKKGVHTACAGKHSC